MTHLLFFLAVGLWPTAQQVVPERILTLGARDGSGPAVFGRIRDVELDEEGTVYVLDDMNLEVRVFALDGAHRGTFGRKGEGPGEFRSLRAIDRAAGDLVVTETDKLSRFSSDGEFVGSQRVPLVGVVRALPLQAEDVVVLREGVARRSGIDGNQVLGIVQQGSLTEILTGASPTLFVRAPGEAMALITSLCSSLYLAPLEGGGSWLAMVVRGS